MLYSRVNPQKEVSLEIFIIFSCLHRPRSQVFGFGLGFEREREKGGKKRKCVTQAMRLKYSEWPESGGSPPC